MKVHMNQKIALLIVLVVVSAQSFIFLVPLKSVIVASAKLLAASTVAGVASGVTNHVISNAMKKTYRPKSVQHILEGIQHYITSTPALNDRASFALISEQIKFDDNHSEANTSSNRTVTRNTTTSKRQVKRPKFPRTKTRASS